MKKTFVLFLFLLGLTNIAFAQKSAKELKAEMAAIAKAQTSDQKVVKAELHWEKYFKSAITKAKKEKKPIFVLFTGTDWCVPCKKLEKNVLETQKFKNYADKYFVLYKADFPRDKSLVKRQNRQHNQSLKKKFKQRSFPTIIVIDDNGNAYGQKAGIDSWNSYYDFFDKVVMNIKSKKFIE